MDSLGARPPAWIRLFVTHRLRMLLGSFFGWLTILCGIGLMGLSGWFISATASAGMTAATAHLFNFFYPSIGVRLFAFARTASRYAERIFTHDATFRILESLRVWFYRKLEPLAPAGLAGFRSGDVLNRIVSDIDALDNLYLRVLSPAAVAIGVILAVTVFLLALDLSICLSTLLGLTLCAAAVPAAAAGLGEHTGRQLARQTADLRVEIVDGLQGLAELLVFDAAHRHRSRLLEGYQRVIGLQRRLSHIRGASGALVTLLSGLAVTVALYIGVARVSEGALAGTQLAMVAMAVLASFEAVAYLPAAFLFLGRTRAAVRRLEEVVELPPPVMFPSSSGRLPERPTIRFDGVCFRYAAAAPMVLKDFALTVPYGERLAVLGQTGAGKSTLFDLLVRFRDPSVGGIFIGERDIRTLAEGDLRRLMTVVSQRAHIFTATVRDNLLIARPDAGEGDLRAALAGARMLDFVDSLPEGIDTWIGEAGRLLSGGQARRLAVARAILKGAPVWLLDEPTEGLERGTAQALLESILVQTAGRTLVMITHRPEMLPAMDRIVILEGGRVAHSGSHEELLTSYPRYGDLYRMG